MDVIRRSFSILLKVKGSKSKPSFSYEFYMGNQANLAHENGEDVNQILEKEVIYYGDRKVKVKELREHIIKSTLDFLKEGNKKT